MSNKLDKLASEMRKMKPSKASRQGAMDAAMAAFSAEFSPEEIAEKTAEKPAEKIETSEKNTTATQGTAAAARPTGQTTRTTRVQTFGRQTMAKFNALTNFKPQTMMMGGTCAAALIAGLIVFPVMGELSTPQQGAVSAPVEAVVAEQGDSQRPKALDETVSGEISENSSELLNGADTQTAPKQAIEPIADASTKATAPNVITVERKVLKTPARVEERNVPAQYGTIERRTQSQPERAEWREIPPTPEDIAAGAAPKYEPVVVPSQFQVSSEQIVLRQAEKELVTVPPTFETVRETIAVQPDGTQTVVSSEVIAPAAEPAPAPEALPSPAPNSADDTVVVTTARSEKSQSGIGSVNGLLSDVRQNSSKIESENRQRELLSKAQSQLGRLNSNPAPQGLPAAPPVVSAPPTGLVSGRTQNAAPSVDAAAPATNTEKVGSLTLKIIPGKPAVNARVNSSTKGQFTVFNGTTNQVVESTETIVNQTGEILCRVLIPAKYKTVTKQVMISPAQSEKVVIPAVTKDYTVKFANADGTFREVIKKIVVEEERVDYIIHPAKYETRSERVLVEPAREEWKPGAQAINSGALTASAATSFKPATPPKYILRDDDGNIVREFENRDAFEIYKANLPTPVAEKPVSTFSVDVDTASYSFMRASINAGKLPPRESIRLEEMINYFSYDYAAPKSADEPFKANVTVTPNPWNADKKLMHIGIKGYVPPASEKPRSNLVFLIDTSGSMNQANKLPLLINSFKLLLNTLDEDDTVSIVAYASASGTVLEPTRVKDKDDILKALNNLRAGGSTAGAAGLELAYLKAQENFDDEGVNRVILATDGDFNVGFSSPDDMKTFIEEKRESGIVLSVLGFGMGNYNDHLMQSLAQNGNGVAAYIDSLSEAQKVLANEAGSALFTIAKDVKIQVEFNPATIAEYRLIGYETRALKRQDFNNDKVDAGEIGAGHTVTAIYEMTPVGSPAVTVDSLRYVPETPPTNTGSDEYAFVKIRHKLPDADTSTLQTFPIGKRQERSLRRASDDMRFATAVSIVGQKLRGDTAVEDYSYADAIKLAKGAKGDDENGYRAEFIQLVKLIETMDK